MILMVAVALGIYIRNCFRRKQEELNEYMELADELRHTLYHKEESIANNEAFTKRKSISQEDLAEIRRMIDSYGEE